ncbi:MAG: hypothetical protein M3300_11230 [Actinomycetota bacterium]|nr:hypothetical protein [Actinomycetota bacterium]
MAVSRFTRAVLWRELVVQRTGSTYGRWGVSWLDDPGSDVGIVRFSRAAGLPAPAPDVLGLALRLHATGTQHDLLLATTGMRPGWRHGLVARRHALRVPYGSLLPYEAPAARYSSQRSPEPMRRPVSAPPRWPAQLPPPPSPFD